jgi:hypothetical protein
MPVEVICQNCGNHFEGNYCNECGQRVIAGRYTMKHLVNLVLDSFNLQRGLFFTFKMLFTNPGKLINDYLDGRSRDFYNPLKYLILVASINAVLMLWFDVFDTNVATTNEFLGEQPEGNPLQKKLIGYMKTYLNLVSLFVLPFYALVSKWVFSRFKLYYAEHLIINGYLFAQYITLQMFIYLLFAALPALTAYAMPAAFVVFIIYYTYAFTGIFNVSWFGSLWRSIVIYLLGFLFFIMFVSLVLVVVVFILKLGGMDLKELVG